MLNQEWSEFLENGVAMTLSCCDSELKSKGARCIGAVVGLDRKTVTFYIQKDSALRVLPILKEQTHVAVVASLPSTYKTLQVKGSYLSHREADSRDRIILERYRELFFAETDKAGVPSQVMRLMVTFPAIAVDVEITQLFLSTPGQDAGTPL
ncbi:hypothetical protein [Bdellovibrio bacteriovorus]|uniref:hypothetical protein n=1 Tax=Bdellovibrio bacteriovorus TaxID=959 RepID=UPI0035A5730D